MSQLQDAIGAELPVRVGTTGLPISAGATTAWLMRQLHDGPVQSLALALLQLDRMLDGARTVDTHLLGNVRTLVRDALQGTRYVLEECGEDKANDPVSLGPALMTLGRRYGSLTGQVLVLDCETRICDPPASVVAVVLQAAQELLINACRHAPGARVELALVAVIGGFELRVSDDGPGFDPVAVYRRRDLPGNVGLRGMSDRLALVGATLSVQSHPGAGVQACIRWSGKVADPMDWPVR